MGQRLSKIDRMHQIVRTMEALDRWDGAIYKLLKHDGYTVTMIAKATHLKPSSHLRRIMDACVTAGWLEKERHSYRVRCDKYAYTVTDLGREMVRELRAQESPF